MFIHVHVTRKITNSSSVVIACPNCKAHDALARVYDSTESVFFFPILTTTWLRCDSCGREYYLRLRAAAAGDLTVPELSALLRPHLAAAYKLLVITGLIFCFLPAMGAICSAISLIGTFRYGGIWRTLSFVGLIIGTIFNLLLLMLALLH